ncbi:hypothetical protein C8R43DRAFT_964923 [Mycena crocata]|nr:hypothetical protein C8R43DRAFT_964923 [Mycena crocata]
MTLARNADACSNTDHNGHAPVHTLHRKTDIIEVGKTCGGMVTRIRRRIARNGLSRPNDEANRRGKARLMMLWSSKRSRRELARLAHRQTTSERTAGRSSALSANSTKSRLAETSANGFERTYNERAERGYMVVVESERCERGNEVNIIKYGREVPVQTIHGHDEPKLQSTGWPRLHLLPRPRAFNQNIQCAVIPSDPELVLPGIYDTPIRKAFMLNISFIYPDFVNGFCEISQEPQEEFKHSSLPVATSGGYIRGGCACGANFERCTVTTGMRRTNDPSDAKVEAVEGNAPKHN